MQDQRRIPMPRRVLRWGVAAAAVVAATAVPAVRAETPPPPPPLTGELLLGAPATPDDFATTTPGGCDTAGASTFAYDASGTADGPYPGTFTEHGTVTVEPQTGAVGSFGFATGPVSAFSAEFTITSGSTTVRGTRWLELAVVPDPRGACAGFSDRVVERFAAMGPLSGFTKEVVVGAGYEATVTTPDGVFIDRGRANSSWSLIQYQRGDCACPGYSSSYAMRLTSSGIGPVPPADATPPVVVGAADRSPNEHGWYRQPVTISWSATDDSGSATTPAPTLAEVEGEAVTYTSEASLDGAGNRGVGSYVVSLDRTAPVVSVDGIDRATILLGEPVPSATCSATDALSGLTGPCTGTLSGGSANGVGVFTYRGEAVDRAGNVGATTTTYQVAYRFDGFAQPVNDTAHDEGTHSVFKAGSTVPLKIQLRRADGTIVQPAVAPRWIAPVRGVPTAAPVNEIAAGVPTEGDEYRYDPDGELWIFNWQTAKEQAGYSWRVGVALDDGSTHTVTIGLR